METVLIDETVIGAIKCYGIGLCYIVRASSPPEVTLHSILAWLGWDRHHRFPCHNVDLIQKVPAEARILHLAALVWKTAMEAA